MKMYISTALIFLSLVACESKNKNVANDEMKAIHFAPTIVKQDKEITEKEASMAEDIEVAKPNDNIGAANNKIADAPLGKAKGYNASSSTNNPVNDTSKKIIKSGDIEFETGNVMLTRKKILHSLQKYGGYVDEDNQSVNGDDNHKEYVLKIRIPAKYFDFMLDSVSSTADKIDTKNISVTDVSTRYIDIKTRLQNKMILEKRYLDLLKKASRIPDLLEIENKITEIRSDIESTQGQLIYLNKQVAYSFLAITFYTKQVEKTDKGVGFGYKFKTALSDGWTALQNLFLGLISSWPYAIAIMLSYWLFKTWRKRRKRANL